MIVCYAVLNWRDASTGRLICIPCLTVDDGPDDPPEYFRSARAAWALGLFGDAFYIATPRGYDAAMARNIATACRPEEVP